jgi:hypothetical protein
LEWEAANWVGWGGDTWGNYSRTLIDKDTKMFASRMKFEAWSFVTYYGKNNAF